ncbi:MAG: hypothetical protein K1060chlam1_00356 [Candidatus Anoxychlamydiales bacterium]|nr:hypothetical protein [Candidatus Anoxychlamydiales bacterium]
MLATKLIALPNTITSENNYNLQNPKNEKLYISHENLSFRDDGIFLYLDHSVIPLNNIYCDEQGYYLKKLSKNIKNKAGDEEIWQCNNCKTIFFPAIYNSYKCPSCGSRDAKPIHYS